MATPDTASQYSVNVAREAGLRLHVGDYFTLGWSFGLRVQADTGKPSAMNASAVSFPITPVS